MSNKPWQAAVKRIKITKNKKLLKKHAGANHFNKPKERGKTVSAKRRMVKVPSMVRKML